MEHFEDHDWIDFLRGVLEPSRKAGLEAHLSQGCPTCDDAGARWGHVLQLAGRLMQFEAPDEAVRRAKAAYRLADIAKVPLSAIEFARMVFDSFLSPALAGARSSWFGQRHCMYQSGGVTVEFHLGAGRENDRSFLTGQIAEPAGRRASLLGSQVKLIEGPSVIAQTATNDFGEFMLELIIHESQWILVEIPERRPIAIPIPNPS